MQANGLASNEWKEAPMRTPTTYCIKLPKAAWAGGFKAPAFHKGNDSEHYFEIFGWLDTLCPMEPGLIN
jgi:secreted trypsin-like serine protease